MNYCISPENTVGLGTNKCIQVWYLSKIWILVQINAQRMKSTTFPTTGLAYSQKLSTGNNQLGASVHQKIVVACANFPLSTIGLFLTASVVELKSSKLGLIKSKRDTKIQIKDKIQLRVKSSKNMCW